MSSRLVDGVRLPEPVSGVASLEFCNTRAGWGERSPREYLTSYEHLAVWAREVGLVEPEATAALVRRANRDADGAAGVLADALRLRADAYGVLTGRSSGAAWRRVAAAAGAAAGLRVLQRQPSGAVWALPTGVGLRLPLHAAALAVADLLTDGHVKYVAACPGHGCGWLFADPYGRRRWCSMAVCGNRAKARRHAERFRQSKSQER